MMQEKLNNVLMLDILLETTDIRKVHGFDYIFGDFLHFGRPDKVASGGPDKVVSLIF